MIDFGQPRKREPYEPMIPLINVVFLMLIFFLLTGELSPTDPVEVTPPVGEIDASDPFDELIIFVDVEGLVYIRERILGPDIVSSYVAQIFAEEGRPSIVIKADENAPADDVITLLENLRALDIEEVMVITQEFDK